MNAREQSFDSVVAAEDLLRRDGVVRQTVRHEAAQKTNVPKEKMIFDNLVPLVDSGDVDQMLEAREEEAARRRRRNQERKYGTSKGSSRSGSSTFRRHPDVDLANRLEPDIRDFWNPEWEIGRPDWRLPFDPDQVVVEDEAFDLDKLVVERAADLSDEVRRIVAIGDKEERVKNKYRSMFYS